MRFGCFKKIFVCLFFVCRRAVTVRTRGTAKTSRFAVVVALVLGLVAGYVAGAAGMKTNALELRSGGHPAHGSGSGSDEVLYFSLLVLKIMLSVLILEKSILPMGSEDEADWKILINRRRRGRTASNPGIDDELGPLL